MNLDALLESQPSTARHPTSVHDTLAQPHARVAASAPAKHSADHAVDADYRRAEAPSKASEQQALNSQRELSQDEQRQVNELKARDREVRAHENAHKAAAGSHARGGISYTYETGPDNKRYAVGGEVSIDTGEVPGNPQATLIKAQIIQRAAMAPAQPSSQDRSVAAEAAQMEARARQELRAERNAEQQPEQAGQSLTRALRELAGMSASAGELFDATV